MLTALTPTVNAWLRQVPTWPIYALCLAPAPWLFFLGLTGRLGPEPIQKLEHEYGILALKFLVAGLCVTPLRRFVGLNLLKFRRLLGLLAFVYVVLHLLVWLLLDVQVLAHIVRDVIKRPYISVGMLAFLILLPLAATSNNWSLRRLGPKRWRRLHMLAYPAVLFGGLHYLLLSKGLQPAPLVYFFIILVLLLSRLRLRF